MISSKGCFDSTPSSLVADESTLKQTEPFHWSIIGVCICMLFPESHCVKSITCHIPICVYINSIFVLLELAEKTWQTFNGIIDKALNFSGNNFYQIIVNVEISDMQQLSQLSATIGYSLECKQKRHFMFRGPEHASGQLHLFIKIIKSSHPWRSISRNS